MKQLFFTGIGLLIFTTVCLAETLYVSDVLKITMRTGQGVEHKIVSIITSGEKVEVLESGEGWTNVRSIKGKEGWVLSRYLTTQEPPRPLLDSLRKKYQTISENFDISSEENTMLKTETQRLRSELSDKEEALNDIKSAFEALKADSSDFLLVKAKLEASSEELVDLRIKSKQLEDMVAKLRKNQIIKGILIGAGILLMGFIVGFSTKRQRRRSSLL